MGEYGRQFFEYVMIISAPTLAPQLDVVSIVLVVLVVAVAVATVLVLMALSFSRTPVPRHVAYLETRPITARRVRITVRARAPSFGSFARA